MLSVPCKDLCEFVQAGLPLQCRHAGMGNGGGIHAEEKFRKMDSSFEKTDEFAPVHKGGHVRRSILISMEPFPGECRRRRDGHCVIFRH